MSNFNNLPNLETIKTEELQAHLDRMKDSEVFFARLAAGEVLAGRTGSAAVMNQHIVSLRANREALCDHHNTVTHAKG